MDPADRAVLSEPSLTGSADQPVARRALRPSHPLDDKPAHATTNQIHGT